METLKIGVREFRDKLATYLLESEAPLAIITSWPQIRFPSSTSGRCSTDPGSRQTQAFC